MMMARRRQAAKEKQISKDKKSEAPISKKEADLIKKIKEKSGAKNGSDSSRKS